jgi:hypothetical protein
LIKIQGGNGNLAQFQEIEKSLKEKNVTDEDLIDGGPNSMGHPVIKPMRMIESENLSENMNIYQSIPDQIFDKGSVRKRKFGSISGNQQKIKEENETDKDSIDVGTNSMGHPATGIMGHPVTGIMGHPVTKPMRMIESENLSDNLNNNQSISDLFFDKNSRRKRKFGSISGN